MQQICNFVTEVVYIFKHWLIIIKIIAIVQRGIAGEEHILLNPAKREVVLVKNEM